MIFDNVYFITGSCFKKVWIRKLGDYNENQIPNRQRVSLKIKETLYGEIIYNLL